jgi:hypothetical protein
MTSLIIDEKSLSGLLSDTGNAFMVIILRKRIPRDVKDKAVVL